MNTKPIFIKEDLHEAVKVLAQRSFKTMGEYVEDLIKASNDYLEYTEEVKQRAVKQALFEKYLEEQALGELE